MKKTLIIVVLMLTVVAIIPVYGLSAASSRAIEAFRRYEPDFANSLRRLHELDRRIENRSFSPGSKKYNDIVFEAGLIEQRIQNRYDLLEDMLNIVVADYPADQSRLYENFSRIDDYYRQIRDFYHYEFAERQVEKEDKKSEPRKIEVGGFLRMDFRNRNEIYRTQEKTAPFTTQETAVPNNLRQARLVLNYQISDDQQMAVENRYLRRERNEPIHENYFTATYLGRLGDSRAWTLRNQLHHAWYPVNYVKNYRNNLTELMFVNTWPGRERFSTVGLQNRVYPGYSRSDFRQFNLRNQESWFKRWGNVFVEKRTNLRRYRNVDGLDYDNHNVYAEYNRSYSGNTSELTLANTFDKRRYDVEAVNLFRTNYYDNYFRAAYNISLHDALAYNLQGHYQKRTYGSDRPRGYAELDLSALATFNLPRRTRAQASYRYLYNDENTRTRAHKNHIVSANWNRRVNRNFSIRIEDTYQMRDTVIGEIMDFNQNHLSAQLSWRFENSLNLSWITEHVNRRYTQLFYRDFRYLQTGLRLSGAKRGSYDWRIDQSWRKFEFRNGNNLSTAWDGETQPHTRVNYNYNLSDDVRLALRASWQKTYYRSFDSMSQELLWDFTRPMNITEFFGSVEYLF